MKNRPQAANEPKDLSKEWHSDSEIPLLLACIRRIHWLHQSAAAAISVSGYLSVG